jgi:16S rRNA processing protein RimM
VHVGNRRLKTFVTAIIGQPYGIAGFVRIKSLSGETAHLKKLVRVTVRCASGTKFDEHSLEIEDYLENGAGFFLKFKGINSPEAARTVRGAELCVEREAAAPLAKGEYYIEDLKGLMLTDCAGEILAVIADVIEGGGGFLLEARLLDGEMRLIPFRNEFIGEISLENRAVELRKSWILT